MDIVSLLSRMSLEDKLMQLTQLVGDFYVSDDRTKFMGLSYGFEADEYMAWNAGSVLGIGGARALKSAQDEIMKRSRHGIPALFMHDIIHGYRTIFPSVLGMACSWQPELLLRAAEISAKEASVAGVHVTFSPMADLARDARWGRVIESTGEDVYLNSLYAAAMVRGNQGDDVRGRYHMASCVKHFAGYGMAEAGRDYNSAEIGEYQLREHHFPAYKAAIDAGAKLVMTSFNALNGIPATGNKWLLADILRNEMSFTGVIISDCTAVYELIMHGFAEDGDDAARKALDAGVDIEMVSTTFYRGVRRLIEAGRLDERRIDEAALRVLSLKQELGLFENPYKDADEDEEARIMLCAEHRAAAREIARDSIVLLKNEGVLPLKDPAANVALLGPYATSHELLDVFSAYGKQEECVSLYEGLHGRANVETAEGCGIYDANENAWHEALALAGRSDIVILALGEHPNMSAEAGSRAYLTLPGRQAEFADAVFKLGKPTAVVLFSGRPLELGSIAEKAGAILQVWFPGTEGGNALADLLLGEYSPSARLTISFPHTIGQCPLYYNAYPTGRPKRDEASDERFCSRYIDAPNRPLYPFGHGLTYSSFEYSPVTLSSVRMGMDGSITASATIRNTGSRAATETVQLYLRDVAGSRVRPVKELKAFRRVELSPGESGTVTFAISPEMLRFHTLEEGYAAEPGKFIVYIAKDALHENAAEFILGS